MNMNDSIQSARIRLTEALAAGAHPNEIAALKSVLIKFLLGRDIQPLNSEE